MFNGSLPIDTSRAELQVNDVKKESQNQRETRAEFNVIHLKKLSSHFISHLHRRDAFAGWGSIFLCFFVKQHLHEKLFQTLPYSTLQAVSASTNERAILHLNNTICSSTKRWTETLDVDSRKYIRCTWMDSSMILR